MGYSAENIAGNKWRVNFDDGFKIVNCPASDNTAAAAIGIVQDMQAAGGVPTPSQAYAVASQGVKLERDRRLAAGAVVSVAGAGLIPVQGRPQDKINLLALDGQARGLLASGVADPVFQFRDGQNVVHALTPAQVVEMVAQGMAAATLIYEASWTLLDGEVIPPDYVDDRFWPVAS